MALNSNEMKSRFEATIYAGLVRVFSSDVAQGQGYPPIAEQAWHQLADALSDIAMDIVNEIQENAQVQVGIQVETTGNAEAQAGQTVTLGKII